jgi:hypothetical protein
MVVMARPNTKTTMNPEMRTTLQAGLQGPRLLLPFAVHDPIELLTRCQVYSRIQTTDEHIKAEDHPYQGRLGHSLPWVDKTVMRGV